MIQAYIGWDDREAAACNVCQFSMVDRASVPIHAEFVRHRPLRHAGLFTRPWQIDARGQYFDERDGQPFSTEFAHSRFLVPTLARRAGLTGWALFSDGDFLWRADVAELLALADPKYALMVVKHDHAPMESHKMDRMRQEAYPRKNWSSLMLFNLDDPRNAPLTPDVVNQATGRYLHGFGWLSEQAIGVLPEAWNWLAGYSSSKIDPKAVHFTLGTPDTIGHDRMPFAAEWRAMQDRVLHPRPTTALRLAGAA